MTKQKSEKHIVKTAIVGLVIMECVALSQGINGTLFSIMIAAVAGLGGLAMDKPKIFK